MEIVRAGGERVDELEPLWTALARHHGEQGPQLGPLLEPAESWRRRREYYRRQLARPGGLLVIAQRGGRPIGYLLATLAGPSHTWDAIDPAAEIATISLLPSERGRGIGKELVDFAKAELRAAGIRQLRLEVLVSNRDAIRFYEREGFHPRFLAMGLPL